MIFKEFHQQYFSERFTENDLKKKKNQMIFYKPLPSHHFTLLHTSDKLSTQQINASKLIQTTKTETVMIYVAFPPFFQHTPTLYTVSVSIIILSIVCLFVCLSMQTSEEYRHRLLTSRISSGTFPIHDNDNIEQSHFVVVFFSKCKCIS